MQIDLIEACNEERWNAALSQTTCYDFYHLPSYHQSAEHGGEGKAVLFVFRSKGTTVAVPMLVRRLNDIPAVTTLTDEYQDATSVYGYSGPVANTTEPNDGMRRAFQQALRDLLRNLSIVTIFARLHPLIATSAWLHGLGEIRDSGTTVSLDLTRPVDEQRSLFRKGHRQEINKMSRAGFESSHDALLTHLDQFISIYHDSMRRVNASKTYYFDRPYFEDLLTNPELDMRLFLTRHRGEVVAGGLFSLCCGIVQYHLSGTRSDYLRLSPMKHLINTVRLWATDQGATVFHLGGGVGGRQDSLFEFKAGFSPVRHTFQTWRWVVDQAAYDQLVAAQDRWNQLHNTVCLDAEFFPRYRCPVTPAEPS